jgi:hypothetical protein
MSPEEKQELLRKQERFLEQPAAEQERLRELHDQLQACPDRAELRAVLARYYAWRATLTSAEKATLDDLPANQRIAHIRELMERQEEQRFRKLVQANLTPDDRKAIFDWLGEFVDAHHQAIIATLPEEFRPRDEYDERQRWQLTFALLRRWSLEEPKEPGEAQMPRPTAAEVQTLLDSLSAQARESMKTVKDPNMRIKVAQEWIRAAIVSRTLPPVSQDDLREFYVNQLSELDRERLEALSGDERQQALQRLYFEHKFRRGGGPPWRGREDGRGGGRGPGPGRDNFDRPPGTPGSGRGPGLGPGSGRGPGPGFGGPGGPPRGGERVPPDAPPADAPPVDGPPVDTSPPE